ncbi:putative multiple sugar transport system permease protein [Treponema bryantii]|uniref:Xylose transport system permease protein XylH n=1 Tax=Treponema bryantii TaxID=163 RepID=A0A1H9E902_9SPIR|nr:multiple monosaccharide ABC transporter permease [Treponema bryantii]BDC94291.1 ABC transporter permease [Treponema bryantii]SEQ22151.1 putative multiple sugar transport system permease protein [Treponema bryantii]
MENKARVSNKLKSVLKGNTMIFILVGVMLLFEILIRISGHGSLFAPANITNIIRQNAYVAILATGMLLCILTGGNIDLSVGSVVALVGALAGVFIVNLGMPIWLAICLCLLMGTLIGAFHGFFIAYIHIPPFITTLAGMLLWRGVATIILDGKPIAPFPQKYLNLFESFIPSPSDETMEKFGELDLFDEWVDKYTLMVTLIITLVCILAFVIMEIISRRKKIKNNYTVSSTGSFVSKLVILSIVILILGQFLARDRGLPVVLILMGVIIAVYSYFTQNTVPGRYLYAIGGNAKAAKLSGVNTDNVMFFAYTNMGFISAVAALVTIARLNSAQPTAGQNYEMDAIASCFIGGASAYGGTGTVSGAVIGAIFMGVLNNGMSILGVDMNWQRAVKGLVLLGAVIFDVVSKRKKTSK